MKKKFLIAVAWTFLVLTIAVTYIYHPVIMGMILNLILVGFLVYRQTQRKDTSRAEAEACRKELDYLKARIRGAQLHALQNVYDGERLYIVQNASGRFDKVWLPNV